MLGFVQKLLERRSKEYNNDGEVNKNDTEGIDSPCRAFDNEKLKCLCPRCGDAITLPSRDCIACKCGLGSISDGVLKYGRGYSSSIVKEHERNLSDANIVGRLAFDDRYASYCDAAFKSLCPPSSIDLRALSLGCGLGFEVSKLVDLGYDAFGVEMADLSSIWAQRLGDRAFRCILSGDGQLPFADETFDLITCINVFEHVGTIPPHEIVTATTEIERQNFILQAYSKLKPGGLFVLTCPHRAYPFDAGHIHAYLPSANDFKRQGFNYVDPFDKRNFLPTWANVIGACQKIAENGGDVCLEFLTDQYLFGGAGPEGQAEDFQDRLDNYSHRWVAETGEPLAGAINPHIQAFIRKAPNMRANLDLDGIWSVEWLQPSSGMTILGEVERIAYLPEANAKWVAPNGAVEPDKLIISPSAAHGALDLACTSVTATFNVHIKHDDQNGATLIGTVDGGPAAVGGRRLRPGRFRYTF
ncbi:methyltransferase domain-containing protein [Methylobacterium mesophilicum]